MARWLAVGILFVALMACEAGAGGGAPADASGGDALGDVGADVAREAIEPWNLVPFARLAAEGTRSFTTLPWPREDREGIQTIRDGREDTAWRPVPGEEASVELDLQPWFQRSLPLVTFAMHFEGPAPEQVRVVLADGCHGEGEHQMTWENPAGQLALDHRRAGCVRLRLRAAEGFALRGLSLLTDDPGRPDELPFQPDPALSLPLAAPTSGVIEGFYGVPWSWAERWRMIHAMSRRGLGAYVYAPKLDPLHRAEWRLPYGEADMGRFAELASAARDRGVTFFLGLSPFIDFDPASEADYEALLEKILDFVDRGVTSVALLADDIEFELEGDVDGALGAAHVAVANRLLADLRALAPDAQLWFCPTAYSDDRTDGWEGGPAYLAEMAGLHEDIEVFWTGLDTFAPVMGPADMQRVTQAIGRPPLIWDNMWANDGGDGFLGRLLLGPFSGRSADFPAAVAGVGHNPSIQGSLSRLTVGTFAHYWAAPEIYDPEAAVAVAAAWESAFGRDGEEGAGAAADADTLAFVVALFAAHSNVEVPAHADFEEALATLRAQILAGEGPEGLAVAPLLPLVGRLVTIASEVHHSGVDAELTDELFHPLARVRYDGLQVAAWLEALGLALAGEAPDEAVARARDYATLSGGVRFTFGSGGVQGLASAVGALAPRAAGFVAPAPAQSAPARCRVGESCAWRPYEGTPALTAHGLPGAVFVEGELRWTPPHAGLWTAVATASTSAGWALRVESLVVVEEGP